MLQFTGSQRTGHDLETEQQQQQHSLSQILLPLKIQTFGIRITEEQGLEVIFTSVPGDSEAQFWVSTDLVNVTQGRSKGLGTTLHRSQRAIRG